MAEGLRAVAELIRSLAWPILVGVAMYTFKPQVASLLTRLRETAGTKFDPLPPQQKADNPSSIEAMPADIQQYRTKATLELEEMVRKYPAVASAVDPLAREQRLITLFARTSLVLIFEQFDNTAWKSQIDLMTYVKMVFVPVAIHHLKKLYYDPACQQNPKVFENYTFEQYLDFLVNYSMIRVTPEGNVVLTPRGYEYLDWRFTAKRPAKTFG